jgi:hypothetical protein
VAFPENKHLKSGQACTDLFRLEKGWWLVVTIRTTSPCTTTNSFNRLPPEVEAGTAAVSTAVTAAEAVAPVAGGGGGTNPPLSSLPLNILAFPSLQTFLLLF